MLKFLREKLAGASWGDLMFSQIEAMIFWVVGGLPGFPGYAARYIACKLLFKNLGGFCWINPHVTIVRANRLVVGKHFGCNVGTYIGASGGITIGDYVLIGSNVTISSGVHSIDGPLPPIFARPVEPKPVVIEDDVWIGAGATIMPGVTLRRGTVIGAHTVVTKSTQEYGVYVGAPARLIRTRQAVTTEPPPL